MNSSPTVKTVHFDDMYLRVELANGRIILTPMNWYPPLQAASLNQLRNYRPICRGTGIEWPDLDYHLSVEGMLQKQATSKAA